MEIISPFKEGIDAIKQAGGETYKYCYQCGMCDSVCPWNRVKKFSMRRLVRQAAFGVPEIDSEDIWQCSTCGRCPQRCPRGVGNIDVAVSFRRIAGQATIYPAPINTVRASLGAEGNPLREKREMRGSWAEGLNVNQFTEDMEILYFPGCYPSFDPRSKKIAKATAAILNSAGVNFGILGSKENCCGESIRKAGDEELFKLLAKENIKTFIDNGVKRILVSSPHCYHTFTHDYKEFKVDFEVVHISQYLLELLKTGRLKLSKEFAKKITYHDPCYLGRHNGIYDQPREVLKNVPGLELREIEDSRQNGLCCGGGGGRIWMDTPKGERFADIRIQQAMKTGAEMLVTACPYCITNFEDSKLSMESSEGLEIKDITEVIQEAL
jgi:Fe-S oxidoreductase